MVIFQRMFWMYDFNWSYILHLNTLSSLTWKGGANFLSLQLYLHCFCLVKANVPFIEGLDLPIWWWLTIFSISTFMCFTSISYPQLNFQSSTTMKFWKWCFWLFNLQHFWHLQWYFQLFIIQFYYQIDICLMHKDKFNTKESDEFWEVYYKNNIIFKNFFF